MKTKLILLSFFILFSLPIKADYVIGYVNGVANTRVQAWRSLQKLEEKVEKDYTQLLTEKIKYRLFWNETHGALEDVLEVFKQKAEESPEFKDKSEFWSAFIKLLKGEDVTDSLNTILLSNVNAFLQDVRNKIQDHTIDKTSVRYTETDSKLKMHADRYTNRCDKILLVAHSQGNLFTNEIYDYIVNKQKYTSNNIKTVHVAVPTEPIKGDYWTSSTDQIINAIRLIDTNVQPANIDDIPLDSIFATGGHSFNGVYLTYPSSLSKIMTSIDNALIALQDPNQGQECLNIVSEPITQATINKQYEYIITTDVEPSTRTIQFSITDKPNWLTLIDNGSTAVLSGTPSEYDDGESTITITAQSIDTGEEATQTFVLTTVAVLNIVSEPVTQATINEQYEYIITTDIEPSTRTIQFSITGNPNWLTLTNNGSTATLSGTPSDSDIGQSTMTITAQSVNTNEEVTQTFSLVVNGAIFEIFVTSLINGDSSNCGTVNQKIGEILVSIGNSSDSCFVLNPENSMLVDNEENIMNINFHDDVPWDEGRVNCSIINRGINFVSVSRTTGDGPFNVGSPDHIHTFGETRVSTSLNIPNIIMRNRLFGGSFHDSATGTYGYGFKNPDDSYVCEVNANAVVKE